MTTEYQPTAPKPAGLPSLADPAAAAASAAPVETEVQALRRELAEMKGRMDQASTAPAAPAQEIILPDTPNGWQMSRGFMTALVEENAEKYAPMKQELEGHFSRWSDRKAHEANERTRQDMFLDNRLYQEGIDRTSVMADKVRRATSDGALSVEEAFEYIVSPARAGESAAAASEAAEAGAELQVHRQVVEEGPGSVVAPRTLAPEGAQTVDAAATREVIDASRRGVGTGRAPGGLNRALFGARTGT